MYIEKTSDTAYCIQDLDAVGVYLIQQGLNEIKTKIQTNPTVDNLRYVATLNHMIETISKK